MTSSNKPFESVVDFGEGTSTKLNQCPDPNCNFESGDYSQNVLRHLKSNKDHGIHKILDTKKARIISPTTTFLYTSEQQNEFNGILETPALLNENEDDNK